jgi:hypothetical protein
MSTAAQPEYLPYGLPMGTVRGFLSVLICSFFWIFLLMGNPAPGDPTPKAPLGHFFLLTLVFLAFASHPIEAMRTSAILPLIMRLIFVGGSIAVLIYIAFTDTQRLASRLTPDAADIPQWPVLLGCLAGGFGVALALRFILGRRSPMFVTIRAWIGVLAMLLLLFETIFQFVILPNMSDKPTQEVMQVWEGILIAVVAAYFGSRA